MATRYFYKRNRHNQSHVGADLPWEVSPDENEIWGVLATDDPKTLKILDEATKIGGAMVVELSADKYEEYVKKKDQWGYRQQRSTYPILDLKSREDQSRSRRPQPVPQVQVSSPVSSTKSEVVAEPAPKLPAKSKTARSARVVVSGPTKDVLPPESIRSSPSKGKASE